MLGDLIRERRKALSMKQGTLARLAGIHQPEVSAIEHGVRDNLTRDVLERIAAALKMRVVLNTDEGAEMQLIPQELIPQELPTTDLPPAVAAVVQRVGKYLDPERWANIAGYIEAKADESREKTSAFGYHVEESQETPQEQPDQKTA